MKKNIKKIISILMTGTLLMSVAGCSANGNAEEEKTGIGFIFVGTKDDYGYNQAAYKGSLAVEEKLGDKVKVYRAENVPETSEASRVMEQQIQQGAKIIFPTSYGHLDPAIEVADKYSDVTFFHQGGLKNTDNLGTYFGTIWESFYLAGIAAGSVTESNKLGFIVSFPIPQVLLNVNAFQLGAQSVNPDVTTTVVFTGSWNDPATQTNSANSLIDNGIDVIAQHQDSTKTVIELCEKRGIKSVGIHADASELAPEGWITGAIWNWDDLFVDMANTALEGKFDGSIYDGKYRGGLKEGIVDIAKFGKNVPQDVVDLVNDTKAKIISGEVFPFDGEVLSQDGTVKIPAGTRPTIDELEEMDYLVKGVIGSIE